MSYNKEEFPRYMRTAGRITVLTAFIGLLVFVVAFVLDVGKQEFSKVSAQTATTTLTVLNTPPEFTLNAFEDPDSSIANPTNSGDDVTWTAVGEDANNAPYFLLICNTNASPTPQAASSTNDLGTEPPECSAGIQWGVSAAASSGDPVSVSTTTTELTPFAESNDWYAWVCDDDPFNPRCNNVPVQGPTSTAASSSPFVVNSRPVLTSASNTGPVDPGDDLGFTSVSSDPDTNGGDDDIFITICSTNSTYDTNTNTCTDDLASSTAGVLANAAATRTIAIPTRDQGYSAFAYIYDEHGHNALANPIDVTFDVSNVAPFVLGGNIELYGQAGPGSDLSVTIPAGETPSSTLNFTIQDNNSCENSIGGDEITDFQFSVFRSGVGTSTCDTTATGYDPNNCYPSGVGTTTWNYTCTATTTCSGPLQDNIEYTCDFPLWFVADPTDNNPGFTPASLEAQNWTAAVAGTDDDNETGTLATTSSPVELISFTAIDILAADIAYGGVEPGDDTGTDNATSTAQNVGNTGLDQEVRGDAMCGTYSPGTPCPTSSTSTIPDNQQEFSASTFTYGAGTDLSSTTDQEAELNVAKTTATSTPNTAQTYWGIAVPASITLAGNYTGLNTFTAVTAEEGDW